MNYTEVEIIIVEDTPEDAELMLMSLRKNMLANDLIVLEDGQEALDYVFCEGKYSSRNKKLLPKVIFLDLKLPKVHGLDVLKKIKSDTRTAKIPVVIVTSSSEDPDVLKAYEYGANSYVVKPVDFSSFKNTMTELGSYWLVINKEPIP